MSGTPCEYKTARGTSTPLDDLLNAHWWTPLAASLPLWLDANAITLIGTVVVLLGTLGLTCGDDPPRSAYAVAAVSVFIYQTLDAIDGKHARRCGTAGPLGHLVDHGCDAIATVVITGAYAASLRLEWPYALVVEICMLTVYFVGQWEELHSHTLRTNLEALAFGVTEMQFIGIACMLAAAFLGPECLTQPLWSGIPWSTVQHILYIATLVLSLCIIASCARGAYSRSPFWSATRDLTPAALVLLPSVAFMSHDVSYPRLLTVSIGTAFAHLSCQVIVCSLTRMPLPLLKGALIASPLWAAYAATALGAESYALLAALQAAAAAWFTMFVERAYRDITKMKVC